MEPAKSCKSAGRPREFCTDAALDRALDVFWRKGYEGTTLPDLTAAMGINRPSLYAAFGNKESLFRRALDRYAERQGGRFAELLDAPTARAAAERVLRSAAGGHCDAGRPRGCLLVHGALACGSGAEAVRQELVARRAGAELLLHERFLRAVQTGELPDAATAASLARFVATVLDGLAVRATGGAAAEELRDIADTALNAWPVAASLPENA